MKRAAHLVFALLLGGLLLCAAGRDKSGSAAAEPTGTGDPGALFIIGGGSRPPAMIDRLIDEAGLREGGYAVILPMSSSQPDTSVFYARKQFVENGIDAAHGLNFGQFVESDPARLDSIRAARLVYLTGGDQSRFMDRVEGTAIDEAIRESYHRGHVIAGTSAGAALMSARMITGNELKHPDYQSTFATLEADNIEIREGLGLLTGVMVDQHFIARSRYNRLLTAVIEFPDIMGIGIDESTAILVEEGQAEVVGEGQVVTFTNAEQSAREQDGLLGAENLRLDIYLPGEKFTVQ